MFVGPSETMWRRKWQSIPVFLPGESQGQRNLVGCRLWGRTESDTTEAMQQQQQHIYTSTHSRGDLRSSYISSWWMERGAMMADHSKLTKQNEQELR